MDIISRCDSSLKYLVITASRDSKDKVRQLISNCIASLRNIKNLQSCSTFLDEFLSHAQILAKCRPSNGNHTKNVNDFLEFGKFLLQSIDISKDQREVQSARALYHACLSITQEQTDHYSFIFYPPYTHEIFEYPSVYTFNYEYRDRILIPLFKLTDTKTNFIIFTSDDESLIHENALWFYNQYTELDIVTDLNSLQTAFNEDRQVLAFISVFDATTFMIQTMVRKHLK
ncbi:hypothetical protein TVAG_128210 [Trichomonas vaginalis G3]|uniref:Uncharacterized protein n=1 Tax=Trichomonas vaginalis (strain ATCC PRA-98 / G3) TaxID=412133 RepID=A2EBI2_TRIV3|nr:protein polyubiquitination [Trichomonas vaginalis G3]EAY10012.1 hypothetical protein TVAG_128210 [Trichomonas vaginalis G3]KAI5535084.1 protein polyubiquitination [Trichomonas vaginalis G3]|eukprot:XP_001322235.1 hypothetical protein [Trichomonas vaginalis G3]